MVILADLRDEQFKLNPDSIYVCGMWSEPYMQQFPGVGYSQTPYKMKALRINGTIYVPDHIYSMRPKNERDYSQYPMRKAWIAIPDYAIESVA